ncbi:DUF4349 domain-containing protein [Kitasatospora sp. NPDC052868]|uniref:DUF4349 domain-containing protein n=1 Tax=Kitasatospora sp. NPDC052868 TaxID=3364060 RepID=UPI0037C9DE2A
MTRGRRGPGVLTAGVVAAVVLVGGCGAAERGSDSMAAKQDAAAAPAAGAPALGEGAPAAGGAGLAKPSVAPPAAGDGRAATGAPPSAAAPVTDTRLIAYTAQLTLRTKDVAKVLEQARVLTAASGGYVGGETVNGGANDSAGATGQITVKVPSASFQQTLDQLAALGEVLTRKSQADDVTQQVADVASRVQTQQASVERVRALMAQAKTLSEITSLESELSRREADLESLQKQVKELSARTSLSTITLDVRREAKPVQHDEPDPKKKEKGFWASVGSALGGGWDVLVTIVRGLAMAVAAVTPFLLVLSPLAVVLWLLRRRRAGAETAAGTGTAAEPTVPPQPAYQPGDEQDA